MKYGKRITKNRKIFEHFDKKVDIDIYDSSHRTLIKVETDGRIILVINYYFHY